MSEQVKRYWLESFIDDFYKARQFVLASDYDALAQRCRELESKIDLLRYALSKRDADN